MNTKWKPSCIMRLLWCRYVIYSFTSYWDQKCSLLIKYYDIISINTDQRLEPNKALKCLFIFFIIMKYYTIMIADYNYLIKIITFFFSYQHFFISVVSLEQLCDENCLVWNEIMEKKVKVKQRNCWNQIKGTSNKLCYCEKKKDEIQIILNHF